MFAKPHHEVLFQLPAVTAAVELHESFGKAIRPCQGGQASRWPLG